MDYSNIKPFWIIDISEVNIPDSLNYLLPDPDREVILNDVKLENLINILRDGNKDALKMSGLFKKGFDDKKTERLINLWKKGVKVFPPSIMFCYKSDGLIIGDGRHRINLALFLGATHIPVVVALNEKNLIEHLLGRKEAY